MLQGDPFFRPLHPLDGYLPLEDLSLIGDGATCTLVGLDGGGTLDASLLALPLRTTGEFMGNFPQAFSHIGVIFSGVTLAATGWKQ